ncbi:hypothetical protein scyTo_0001923 [Scyliorhinus torazame]|uniref:Uncharacterized protein n=1 Tax=Scyliorhinus torazame TaxID=75743 RepID=A0A401PGU3_SCYTO|nr:hypothetical protein [Scyliorhinus torazame]
MSSTIAELKEVSTSLDTDMAQSENKTKGKDNVLLQTEKEKTEIRSEIGNLTLERKELDEEKALGVSDRLRTIKLNEKIHRLAK